ncbi:Ferredoxin subunit of nitrite reductase or a ring-hydroxylating dioxygenase [Nocardioides terrae]|uniref:Cytochrome bc1 complex Rieske iron-sulfur subunit n=1 Tax=Nocardioides terrae TaxID=574651 RepID=A0A1I1JTF0_9ACTN|nr:Rieske (2Fe-2S) protein [Nocardioides terrae]SFC51927.1 Ferredoxin subunit of nitrite reductase or a ring-hydroxylating dioxygenase [Nocardioides terrae]
MRDQITRRTTLAGAGLTAAVPVLAACGGSNASEGDEIPAGAVLPTATPSAGVVVGPTSDVPVGGGKIYGDLNVVVTQPEEGTFHAFSATCTHQGCQVSKIVNHAIQCSCHFSKYSLADGSVQGGPAPEPLPPIDISVANGQITVS